jgi:nitrogen regulatory protein P-II 1
VKKLVVFIKPFKLEPLLGKLPEKGVIEIALSDVRGYGRQKGHLELYKGHEYELTFLPKLRLEIYCEDAVVEAVEKAVMDGARTGRIGDGKIMVASIEQCEQF